MEKFPLLTDFYWLLFLFFSFPLFFPLLYPAGGITPAMGLITLQRSWLAMHCMYGTVTLKPFALFTIVPFEDHMFILFFILLQGSHTAFMSPHGTITSPIPTSGVATGLSTPFNDCSGRG